jgi:hypothetical protein
MKAGSFSVVTGRTRAFRRGRSLRGGLAVSQSADANIQVIRIPQIG